jgi:hypothetical protein
MNHMNVTDAVNSAPPVGPYVEAAANSEPCDASAPSLGISPAERNGTAHAATESTDAATPRPESAMPEEPAAADEGPSSLERAEELANRIGMAVGLATAVAGQSVIRFAVRAREAFADFLAEAQSIRQAKKSDAKTSDQPAE